MIYDLVITNGTVSLPKEKQITSVQINIGIQNGKIAEISASQLQGKTTIDAKHLHILPGVIDSQVHFREPGLIHKEDLESGTRSAALGGVTSVFEMPNTKPSTTTQAAFEEKVQLATNRAWVNFAFYIGASPENIDQLAKLEQLPGCPGVKVFMGSSTGSLLVESDELLEKVFLSGKKRVIIHSEDEFRLKERKNIALESKDVRKHHIWRDVETAVRSTERLLKLARKTGRKVHVLHVTTKEEVEILKKNRDIATFEITPNHLTLWAPDCYEKLGSKAQMNPPVREKTHYDALWLAVQQGYADVIGTDHAPHTLEEKAKQYPDTPSGMPGVQTVVPLFLNHIHNGKLSLSRFVELMCENPRRVFGCQSKGRIEVGLDADFTIVDLKKENIILNSKIASKCGWTPFDGMKVTGWPTHTIVGGDIVMQNDELISAKKGTKVLFS